MAMVKTYSELQQPLMLKVNMSPLKCLLIFNMTTQPDSKNALVMVESMNIWLNGQIQKNPDVEICIVFATIPGYPAADWVGTKTWAPVWVWSSQGTNPPNDEQFETWSSPTALAIFAGFLLISASCLQTQNFSSNWGLKFWLDHTIFHI